MVITTEKPRGKAALKAAIVALHEVDKLVEGVREQFNMEWGENAHSDLDVALTVGVIRKLHEARDELGEILRRYQEKTLKPNFPRPKAKKREYTLADLPLVF